ncbi:MAG: flavin reductase family protein [Mailhella sp.]|nr:flavin reductase family protein [Mailhella sp.]
MKQYIEPFSHATEIGKALEKSILLTTKRGDEVNTMTIGWGFLGIMWGKPMFMALVRESRYTKQFLDENGEFTINVPLGTDEKEILAYCGTRSGRDVDKIKDMKLTLEEPDVISVPGIREFPLTLECRTVYKQGMEEAGIPQSVLDRHYPVKTIKRDIHTLYYGEILSSYIIS